MELVKKGALAVAYQEGREVRGADGLPDVTALKYMAVTREDEAEMVAGRSCAELAGVVRKAERWRTLSSALSILTSEEMLGRAVWIRRSGTFGLPYR